MNTTDMPKYNPPPMPETALCKAEDICCGTLSLAKAAEDVENTLTIMCNKIVLRQDGIGIDLDIPSLSKIRRIVINGTVFVKED